MQINPLIRHGSLLLLLMGSLAQAAPISKPNYEAGKVRVQEAYQQEKSLCDHVSGNDSEVCLEQARANRNIQLAELEAQFKGSQAAWIEAEQEKAESNYNVAKQTCQGMIEEDTKRVCISKARGERDSAFTAIAAERMPDNRTEAQLDEALKKCAALNSNEQNTCREQVRKRYGKS
ncbi:MAG TPA: hypothetical protein VN023_04235 [Methylovorus sp.]|jgi:hypothetical protein|nr:hypothetical protein [Methylovorus sp.]